MSMDLGGAKGGVKSDINVTPMVDVMLVLLIIMMLIAPMLQQGVDLRLPQAANSVDKPETSGQTVLSITNDRRFYVNSVQVAETEMLNRIQGALEGWIPWKISLREAQRAAVSEKKPIFIWAMDGHPLGCT